MNTTKLLKLAVPVLAVLFLYSCSDSPSGPDTGFSEISLVSVIDRDSGDELAHTHGAGSSMHWHGSLPHLHPGEGIEVNVQFFDENGDEISLGGEYTVQARLADGSDEGVVELAGHGDHIDIEAVGEGEVSIIFSLWHGDHSEFDAPVLELGVEDHGHDHGDAPVTRVNILDRDSGDELVHTHGTGEDMHWHGSFPHLHPGESIEVNVEFFDEHGDLIALGDDFSVEARLAEGSAEGVVELASHGDHIDIEALDDGEVEIIFSLVHDGHVEFDAPSITVEVDSH